MDAVLLISPLSITRLRASSSVSSPSLLPPRFLAVQLSLSTSSLSFNSKSRNPSSSSAADGTTLITNSSSARSGVYSVGEFMTKKEDLHVVKPTTTVDEALEILVENRITGFPVIDEDWKLVGLVSDYDLLALDSISGSGRTENAMFPEVDSTWKTFNAVQKLLSKTNGKLVGDLMTPAPLAVEPNTNLEDAAKILLETKYRRLPVVDSDGKLDTLCLSISQLLRHINLHNSISLTLMLSLLASILRRVIIRIFIFFKEPVQSFGMFYFK